MASSEQATTLVGVLTVLVAVSILFILPQLNHNNKQTMATERVLLPTNVVPSKYTVSLAPNFTTFKAPGTVVIAVEVKDATSKIQVHAKEITIQSVEFATDKVNLTTTYLQRF